MLLNEKCPFLQMNCLTSETVMGVFLKDGRYYGNDFKTYGMTCVIGLLLLISLKV